MGIFYVVEGEYLVSHGFAMDGQEGLQAGPGQTVVLGAVPGFGQGQTQGQELAQKPGMRWHVVRCEWVAAGVAATPDTPDSQAPAQGVLPYD